MTLLGDWAFTLALITLLLFSLPTTLEILRKGNEADPLGREIEEEAEKARHDKAA